MSPITSGELVGGAYGGRWSTPVMFSIPEIQSMEA